MELSQPYVSRSEKGEGEERVGGGCTGQERYQR